MVEQAKTVRIHTSLKCKNCGEEVSQYGPETFHVESTLSRCDLPGNDGFIDVIKASVGEK